jgi:hypothetical protein
MILRDTEQVSGLSDCWGALLRDMDTRNLTNCSDPLVRLSYNEDLFAKFVTVCHVGSIEDKPFASANFCCKLLILELSQDCSSPSQRYFPALIERTSFLLVAALYSPCCLPLGSTSAHCMPTSPGHSPRAASRTGSSCPCTSRKTSPSGSTTQRAPGLRPSWASWLRVTPFGRRGPRRTGSSAAGCTASTMRCFRCGPSSSPGVRGLESGTWCPRSRTLSCMRSCVISWAWSRRPITGRRASKRRC